MGHVNMAFFGYVKIFDEVGHSIVIFDEVRHSIVTQFSRKVYKKNN